MKCIIAGSRTITDYRIVERAIIESGWSNEISQVISGSNKYSVDGLGEKWAKKNNIPIQPFFALWDLYGKAAGPLRNQAMANYVAPDGALIAIWDGKSKGTKNMISIAKSKGIKVYVFQVTK